MGFQFSPEEVFRIAEAIEANGAKFYRQAAAKATDARLKQFLEGLASVEDMHYKIFEQMRRDLKAADRQSATFDPQGEAALYLQALADAEIFPVKEPVESIAVAGSTRDALKRAIQAEKDSIVFYLGIQRLVKGEAASEKVGAIVEEEMSHLRALASFVTSLP